MNEEVIDSLKEMTSHLADLKELLRKEPKQASPWMSKKDVAERIRKFVEKDGVVEITQTANRIMSHPMFPKASSAPYMSGGKEHFSGPVWHVNDIDAYMKKWISR